ncbi:hypothetical protein CG709_18500 [Lachnotalea glycerini]|nr:hypothetical protein CG709_18500 [Lachnotalea glycerini]
MDVDPSMIEETEHRIKESGLNNVKTAVTQEYDLKIKEDTVSLALICTVLHEVEDKIRFITETDRILKDNGRIAIIEWIKRETDWGPPVNHRVGSDELQKLLEECKFKDITVKELNEYFYVIMAEK